MKLRTKILSYTLPLILIPFLLTSLAVYYFVIRANQIQLQEENKQTLNEVLVSFRRETDSVRKDVELLSNVPAVAEFLENRTENAVLENQTKSVLELFFKQNPYYLQLSLVDEKGLEKIKFSKIPNQQEPKILTDEDFFLRTLISGSVQTPVREIQTGKYATVFAKSVVGEKFLGMIVLTLNTQSFERPMRPLLKRGLATFLFDDRGIILASAFASIEDKKLSGEINLAAEAAELLAKSSFEANQKKVSGKDKEFLFSVLPSESFPQVDTTEKSAGGNWFLGVFEDAETNSVPRSFQVFFFSILFLAVGAVLWATARGARRITIPLEKVSAATARIGRGEANLKLEINTNDEVEDLANAVRKIDGELREYQKQLIQTAKLAAIGEMTAEISHEIQNRISGISLWLQHLDAEIEPDDPRREYLDEMKLGLGGFMKMLAALKEHYKTPVLDRQNLDVNLLVKEVLPFVQEKIETKQIEISTNFRADLPFIRGDREKLKSVLLNLILNAIDSVKDGGKIEILTDLTEETAEEIIFLSIRDNGCGIEEKDLSRIFYPFYSTKSGGSGLGLAISSNIISAHKGKIKVESEVGKGTVFAVSFPAIRS